MSSTSNGETPNNKGASESELERLLDGVYDKDTSRLHELYGKILSDDSLRQKFLTKTLARAKKFIKENEIE
ncbi:MAG: hypothetical protein AAFN77_24225 [Planctomycetota bacterium]